GTMLDITERKRADAERMQLLTEQAARVQAEAAEQRVAFLAEASTRLASSLDYELTLRNVAELAVPTLADACIVDVLTEEGDVHRVDANRVEAVAEGELASRWRTHIVSAQLVMALRLSDTEHQPVQRDLG